MLGKLLLSPHCPSINPVWQNSPGFVLKCEPESGKLCAELSLEKSVATKTANDNDELIKQLAPSAETREHRATVYKIATYIGC
jgi:hypothetical protein